MDNENVVDESQFPKELIEEKEEPKGAPPEHKISESLYGQIMKMSVSEKIRLATIGNREARNILIKESNRIVLSAIINSPKMTEDDALMYASNRSLADEVIKLITLKKEFLQNYKIKLALVTNPKTPPTISLKLLNHVMEKDLRRIAKDKNVNPLITRQAMRVLSKQGKV
ncbi:MAG: hypothetical protein NTV89_06465 [Proteobacteria bacterium]|nr:hypothetical protein [Pseudomonadota bacterium]